MRMMEGEGRIVRYLIVSAIFSSNYLSMTRYRLQNDVNFVPDFVVIGGGTGGAVVTTRLIDAGFNVVLLERGGSGNFYTDIPLISHEIDHEDEFIEEFRAYEKNACLAIKGCILKVGNALGGGSTHNTLNFVRGSPLDYDTWQALGADGWSYRDVLPYFMELEDARNISFFDPSVRGSKGPIKVEQTTLVPPIANAFLSGLKELGYEEGDNNVDPTKIGLAQMFIGKGVRQSTLNSYLDRVIGSERLKVISGALVTKVITSKDERDSTIRATGVEFLYQSNRYTIKVKNDVIVSAGALGSPKVLMLSGIGPRQQLEKHNIPVVLDLPGVGENFQNHIAVGLDLKIPTQFQHQLTPIDVREYNDRRTGILAQHDRAILAAFRGRNSSHPFDTEYQMMVQLKNSLSEDPDERSPIYDDNVKIDLVAVSMTYLDINDRGKISLNSTNPFGQVEIRLNELSDQRDVDGTVEMIRFAIRVVNTESIQKLKPQWLEDPKGLCQQYKVQDVDDTRYLECYAHNYSMSSHHYVGSCKMGRRDDPIAVVDNRLKVIGVEGLRVVDASVMPTVPRGNTNIPTIMVAEKASDIIVSDYLVKRRKIGK